MGCDKIFERQTGWDAVVRVTVGRFAACVEREHYERAYIDSRKHKVVGGGGKTRQWLILRMMEPGGGCQQVLRLNVDEVGDLLDAVDKLDLTDSRHRD